MSVLPVGDEAVRWGRLRQSHALASMDRLRFSPGPPAWSPNGEAIAFYWADELELQVWLFTIDSRLLARVTKPPFAGIARQRTVMDRLFADHPDWLPPGDRLAVVGRFRGEEQSIYLLGLDGTIERLVGGPGVPRNPRSSPDGRRIVFVSYRDGKDDIWLADLPSGNLWQLTWDRFDNTDPQWSPDGESIVYTSQRSEIDPLCSQLCLLTLGDGAVTPLPENPRSHSRFARWRDTDHLCFLSDRSGYDEVWEIDLRTGRLRMVTHPTVQDKGEFDIRPQGATIAFTQAQSTNRHLYALDMATGATRVLLDSDGVILWPTLARSRQLVACWHSGPVSPPEIVVMDMSGKEVARTKTAPPPERVGQVHAVNIPSTDGLTIDALVYSPDPQRARPTPGVLWIHGGPNAQHLNVWEPFFHRLTQAGLTILAPNSRGSTGYGRAFMDANLRDWAGGDAQDWRACLQHLAAFKNVDANRLYVWGRSYGGYAVLMALCLFPDLVKAGVCQFGPVDLVSFFQQTSVRHLMVRFLGLPLWKRELYTARSPITHLEKIRAPLLVLQGDKDVAVPPTQAELLAHRLGQLGVPFEYVCYEGEGHGFDQSPHILDAATRIERFFTTTLTDSTSTIQAAAQR